MAFLLELILTLALIIAAIKLGWLGTILFVLLYIVAFMLKLPFLARRSKVTPRFLAFVALFLTLGLFMRKLVDVILFSTGVQNMITRPGFFSGILRFFLGTDLLKEFWSFVIGFGATAFIIGVPLVIYGYMAGQNMYSQYEQYQGHEWEATQSAISIFLGINRGTWVVSDGKAEVRGESGSGLQRFGGPGILIVQEGHAVVLEKSGNLSRVVGRGISWLEPFERINMVVPLFARKEHIVVEHVSTKDRVCLEEFEFWAYHKVESGPEEDSETNGMIPYSRAVVLEKIWSPVGGDWRGAIQSVGETATRDVVGRHDLEEIVTLAGESRESFRTELLEQMNKVTREKMGINVTTVDFGRIKAPAEAQRKMLEKWSAQQQVQIAIAEKEVALVQGEVRLQAVRDLETARAAAQEQMILAISSGFGAAGVRGNAVPVTMMSLRLMEALEKIAEDPAAKLVFPAGLNVQELINLLANPAASVGGNQSLPGVNAGESGVVAQDNPDST